MKRRDFLKYGLSGLPVLMMESSLLLSACRQPAIAGDATSIFDDNTSYWARFLPSVNPSLNRDLQVDVAVIGGGYTGLSAAYHIKQSNPGISVALFEAKRVGNAASGRNGALVLAQTYSEGGFVMGEYRAHHKQIYDITVNSMWRLKALAESSGIDPGYILNGQCLGIFNADNIASARQYVAEARALGMPIEYWEQGKARALLGATQLLGAVYDPNGGTVNPGKLVAALKKLAEDVGVQIYENSPIWQYQAAASITLPDVTSQQYQVTAKSIVIAANAYAAATLDFMTEEIIPAHTQVAVTAPLTEAQYRSLGWQNHLAWYDDQYAGSDADATFHMVMTADRRIVIGGGSVEYNNDDSLLYPGDLRKIEAQITRRIGELYPALNGIQIENTWDGIICETRAKREKIGVGGTQRNIYHALGYNGGQGVNAAFLFGELVARLYNGQRHPLLDIYLA